MNSLKKRFIKSLIKLTIVENKPGILKIHIAKLSELDQKYKIYDQYIIGAVKLLKGTHTIDFDYKSSIVAISYNETVITAKKICGWIQVILDVTIDNLEFIEKYSETDTAYMLKKLEEVLQRRLELFDV